MWNVQSHSRKVSGVDRVIQAPTVGEFLRLIKNADLIITNSFHGVAFSINFNKAFVPLLNAKNPARVQNLLQKLELSELIGVSPDKALDFIQYEAVNKRLEMLREESVKWFEDAVRGDATYDGSRG